MAGVSCAYAVSCLILAYGFVCFFFEQKTAYELRISDWSSDVCSSDLDQLEFSGADREPIIAAQLGIPGRLGLAHRAQAVGQAGRGPDPVLVIAVPAALIMRAQMRDDEIGSASCRERVCQYV